MRGRFLDKPRTKAEMLDGIDGIVKSKKIGCNTVEYHLENGDRVIRYHLTDIVTFKKGGRSIVLRTGGYHTPTTKARINAHLPSGWGLYSDKGILFISYREDGKTLIDVPFQEGMRIVDGKRIANVRKDELQRLKFIAKKIKKYVDDMTNIPLSFRDEDYECKACQAMYHNPNEHVADKGHLIDLIERGKVNVFLLHAALKWAGFNDHQFATMRALNVILPRTKQSLRRYLRFQFGLNI